MSDRPWYRRFPDNFIAGTVGLSLEEKGAYSLVLDLIYVRGGPVPDEPRYIAGVCNCSVRKWNAIRQRLIDLGKIEVIDGYLMNRRAEKELETSAETSRERAESGAKGGEKSAENRAVASKSNAVAQAALKHTRASPLPYPDKKNARSATGPTEGLVKVSKLLDPELFAACVSLTDPVPKFLEHKSFPADVVARARQAMAEQSNSGAVH